MTQAAAAASQPVPQSIVNPDGTTNRIWLSSYVSGVSADIDQNKYQSMNQYFDECIAKYRDRTAFVSIGTEMSYGRLGSLVNAFAGWLQSQGVKKGDRVAIMSPNLFQYPVCLFAILRIGAVVVNVNPLYTVRELNHQLKDSGAETIIVMENFAKTVQDSLAGTKIKRIVLTQLGD
ncbi:MAG: AMP-binding protein, partial [Burkholderiales bacterium]|nr:AMP-binding protein [Burkholderiales bacterium]